jgi:hypothetical protein
MALGSQLPLRLEPEVEEKLERVAARIGTSKSALIRLLARTFVEQMVKPDGTVELPPQWSTLLPPVDKRSSVTRPGPVIQRNPQSLLSATTKARAKAKNQEQESMQPLVDKLERMKERRMRREAQLKADPVTPEE